MCVRERKRKMCMYDDARNDTAVEIWQLVLTHCVVPSSSTALFFSITFIYAAVIGELII